MPSAHTIRPLIGVDMPMRAEQCTKTVAQVCTAFRCVAFPSRTVLGTTLRACDRDIAGNQQKEYLTLDQHLTARAKRRGKSAQAHLLELLFTNLPIFLRSRVMLGLSTSGFGNAPRDLRDVCAPHSVPVVTAPARS